VSEQWLNPEEFPGACAVVKIGEKALKALLFLEKSIR
jgi:hypothetical protein